MSDAEDDPGTRERGGAIHDERHRGEEHASPYGLSRLAPAISLVNVAKEIESASETISVVTHAKLEVIAKQIRALQQEAQAIMSSAEKNLELHNATCSFSRKVGHVYHLYARENGTYWSMVSPEEWRGRAPHPFLGSYRLGIDQSWSRVDAEERITSE